MAAALTGPQRPFTQQEIDEALTALVAWSGQATAAVRYLKERAEEEGDTEKRIPSPSALSRWVRTTHWERYDQLREQYSERVESALANDMRDAARAAVEGARLAVDKATARLEADKDDDPARTAANLSRVAQSSTDKLLALTNRPSSITESRSNPEELLRSLIGMGVLQPPVDADAVEDRSELGQGGKDDTGQS